MADLTYPCVLTATSVTPSSGAVPTFPGGIVLNLLVSGNPFLHGYGTLAGTVKEQALPANVPLRRKVRLIRELDGLLIQETWSDATTGAYTFRNVQTEYRYTVVSYDYEHDYRAVIADNLQAVVA